MNKYELLSNTDLVELAEMMGLNITAISKDKLKYLKNIGDGVVLNLDSIGGGTHWVALSILGKDACYFDSFGQEPPMSVIRYCRGKTLIYNEFIIQNLNQEACGYYCLAFLHFMYSNKSVTNMRYKLNSFIKPFDLDDTTKNDNILQSYFKRIRI